MIAGSGSADGRRMRARAEDSGYTGADALGVSETYASPTTTLDVVEGITERYTAVALRDASSSTVIILTTFN